MGWVGGGRGGGGLNCEMRVFKDERFGGRISLGGWNGMQSSAA